MNHSGSGNRKQMQKRFTYVNIYFTLFFRKYSIPVPNLLQYQDENFNKSLNQKLSELKGPGNTVCCKTFGVVY